jgi:hypothetical protein
MEASPRPKQERSPPKVTKAVLVELELPRPDGTSRRVILAYIGRWWGGELKARAGKLSPLANAVIGSWPGRAEVD